MSILTHSSCFSGRHACQECSEEYAVYKRQLVEQYKKQARELRGQMRGEEPDG
jgi:hypothetical protein